MGARCGTSRLTSGAASTPGARLLPRNRKPLIFYVRALHGNQPRRVSLRPQSTTEQWRHMRIRIQSFFLAGACLLPAGEMARAGRRRGHSRGSSAGEFMDLLPGGGIRQRQCGKTGSSGRPWPLCLRRRSVSFSLRADLDSERRKTKRSGSAMNASPAGSPGSHHPPTTSSSV